MDETRATPDDFCLYFGDVTTASANVYVRLPGNIRDRGTKLSGYVRGPACKFSRTLQANIPFRMLSGPALTLPGSAAGAGEERAGERRLPGTSMLRAMIPDPCFWSPELPFLYTAHLEFERPDGSREIVERPIGIRPMRRTRRALSWEGKNFVLRGWRPRDAGELLSSAVARLLPLLPTLREQHLALYMSCDTEEMLTLDTCRYALAAVLRAASDEGVLVLVEVRGDGSAASEFVGWARLIGELSSEAAFGFLVLAGEAGSDEAVSAIRTAGPNLLIGQRVGEGAAIAEWADVAIMEKAAVEVRPAEERREVPWMVLETLLAGQDFEFDASAARDRCDRLQTELAGLGMLSGYVVQ